MLLISGFTRSISFSFWGFFQNKSLPYQWCDQRDHRLLQRFLYDVSESLKHGVLSEIGGFGKQIIRGEIFSRQHNNTYFIFFFSVTLVSLNIR